MLQLEEQRTSLDEEIRIHNTIRHSNVLQLIDSEVVELPNEEARGYLIFPYYEVLIRMEGWIDQWIDRYEWMDMLMNG